MDKHYTAELWMSKICSSNKNYIIYWCWILNNAELNCKNINKNMSSAVLKLSAIIWDFVKINKQLQYNLLYYISVSFLI